MPDPGNPPVRRLTSIGSSPGSPGPVGPGDPRDAVDPGAAAASGGHIGTGGTGAADTEPADSGDAAPGGAEVVAALYADSGPAVLSYVTSLLGDRYLAEDVVQETMLRAWRHCGQLSEEKGSVRGWLMRVAHNIAMDKLRMRRCRPTEVAESAAPELAVSDHAEAVVTAVYVRMALGRLPARHRAVLEQVYLNGLTAAEAAAVLGIPEGTVFSRAYYGLRMLRRQLAPADSPQPTSARAAA
jgi:RNA polymerase sigma-70 factor (ECF subfamily)